MSDPIPASVLWTQKVVDHLKAQRYSEATIAHYRAVTRRFLAFLERQHVDITAAVAEQAASFLDAERRQFQQRNGSGRPGDRWRTHHTRAIHLLFRLAQGSLPTPAPPPVTAREQFCREIYHGFRWWTVDVRGLSLATLRTDWRTAGFFLKWLGERASAASFQQLSPSDLDAFLCWRTRGLRRTSRSTVCQGLRNFLRYLHAAGFIPRNLAGCITGPPRYRNESIPSVFTARQVKAMFKAARADRSAVGHRDFAILLLLTTYGLRAGEITRLRLDDIDWRRESFCVTRSKSGRSSQLPLTIAVGQAILDYLRHDRPQSDYRQVFLGVHAPHRPFSSGSCLYPVVGRWLRRAGITVTGKRGPHALRYTRASSLLHASVPLQAISDLLGHRSSSSTGVYLKLSTEDLRDVGLEIPKEVIP